MNLEDTLVVRVEYDHNGCRYVYYENQEIPDVCVSRTGEKNSTAVVYPQPGRETIYFRTPAPLIPGASATIFEPSGKTVARLSIENDSVRLPRLAPGWYLWRVVSGDRVMNGKLVVE